MERPCGGRFIVLPGVGLDRNLERTHIKIDAAVLELFRLVNAPGRLARDAVARMVHHDQELALGL